MLRAALVAAALCYAFPAAALASAPSIADTGTISVFDNRAQIFADIDPGGETTRWLIKYATDASFTSSGGQYDHETAPMDVPLGSGGAQPVSDVVTGLQPNTVYDFIVEATNSTPPAADSAQQSFPTLPQATGTAGTPVTFPPLQGCPDVVQLTVDWGDGTSNVVPFTCDAGTDTYTLGSPHTYAAPGHYDVTATTGETAPIAGAQIVAAPPTTTTTTTTTTPPPPPPPPSTDVDGLFGTVSLATASMPQPNAPAATPDARAQVKVIVASSKRTVEQQTLTDSHGNYSFTGLPSCIPGPAITCMVQVLDDKGTVADQASITLPDRVSNTRADLVAGRLSEQDWISGVVLAPSDAAGTGGTTDPPGWNLTSVGSSIRAAAGLGPAPRAASSSASELPTTDITVSSVDRTGKATQIYDALKTCQKDDWGAVDAGVGVPSRRASCASTVGPFLLEGVPIASPRGGSTLGESPHYVITLLERNAAGKYVAVDSAQLKLPTGPKAKDGDHPLISAPALNSVVPVPDQPGGRTVSGQVTDLRPFLPRRSAIDPPPAANAEVELSTSTRVGAKSVSATTRTDNTGYYAFSNVPKCASKAGCEYTVSVLTGKTVEDSQKFTLGAVTPSVTVENLTGNITSDQLFVRGSVVLPDGSAPVPDTELTIGPRGRDGTVHAPIFDSRTDCTPKNWGPPPGDRPGGPGAGPCASTVGSYLLSGVDTIANGKLNASATAMVITLLERNPAGKFVAIDSAPITLPAQRGAHPVIDAPTLTAVVPVPTTTNGRTVSGTVTTFRPFLPGAPAAQPAEPGSQVTVTIKTSGTAGKEDVTRTAKTDSKGRYSVTGLPACNPKPRAGPVDTCSVSVDERKTGRDVEEFTLSQLSPTTAQVDLQAGLESASPVLTGTVTAPLSPGKGGPPHTDIQISTPKGQLLYDALTACAKGGWAQPSGPARMPPCVGGYGDYALGSIPALSRTATTATVIVTLLEQNTAGRFNPVDSVKIKLLPGPKPGPEATPVVVSAPTLHG